MTNFNEQSVFGENFKYVVVLSLLAFMTYSSASVRDALAAGSSYDGSYPNTVRMVSMSTTTMHHPYFGEDGQGRFGVISGTSSPSLVWHNPAEARKGLSPEQVVTLLYKQGFIAQDKLAAARALVSRYELMGGATSTRPVPPMPPIPGWQQGSTTRFR